MYENTENIIGIFVCWDGTCKTCQKEGVILMMKEEFEEGVKRVM